MIFWDNLLRYPRFFVSSMIGLILVVLNPIINQLKKFNDNRIIIYIFLFSSLITLVLILKEMLNFD